MKILAVILILFIIILWSGKLRWQNFIASQIKNFDRSPTSQPKPIHLDEVKDLPPIVQKYFHLVLKDGHKIIQSVNLHQIGGFRAKAEIRSWSDMTATQTFATSPKGYVWNAKITMIPGVSIQVCDSYINGKASMQGKILWLITLMDIKNDKELNAGALQRYLAEAVWFPTALLPSQGIRWKKIDDLRAEATLTDHDITVTMSYQFNEKGEIISIYTPNRYREVNGKYVSTPWRARVSNYIESNGYLIPSSGEVEWILKDQVYTYWRANIKQINFYH
jgi:hypothetical protein